MAWVTDRLGLNRETIHRGLSNEVGLTPKLYCRVLRFQQALGLIHRSTPIEWTDVAVPAAITTRRHLIGDFREFSGLTPSAYVRLRSEHLNHVPLAD